ncbi:MAG: hypothetical protein LBK06_06770 [Planctomycetaceae bacterium]|jgi:hypothetical protein|nr:hypothetical protein [Planctomycetaceae bacterium]
MKKCLTIFVSLIICTFVFGCSSQKIPDGFPSKLVPFSVTLLNEGKPVNNTSTVLVTETASPYNAIGNTGSNGTAALATSINNYSKDGIPPGIYKAIITQNFKAPSEVPSEQLGKMSFEELDAYNAKIMQEIAAMPKIVPEKWGNVNETPVKITVPPNGGNITIEITDPKTHQQ